MKSHVKDDILDAFNELLATKSIEKITISEIIKKAQISKATFYRYFKDKYDVMSYNFDKILDYSAASAENLEDLFYYILKGFSTINMNTKKNMANYNGDNSTNDHIYTVSMNFLIKIAAKNRNGKELTPDEDFQARILCSGIAHAMPETFIVPKNDESYRYYARLLSQLFPASLQELI